jgi:hypothetical protein
MHVPLTRRTCRKTAEVHTTTTSTMCIGLGTRAHWPTRLLCTAIVLEVAWHHDTRHDDLFRKTVRRCVYLHDPFGQWSTNVSTYMCLRGQCTCGAVVRKMYAKAREACGIAPHRIQYPAPYGIMPSTYLSVRFRNVNYDIHTPPSLSTY